MSIAMQNEINALKERCSALEEQIAELRNAQQPVQTPGILSGLFKKPEAPKK